MAELSEQVLTPLIVCQIESEFLHIVPSQVDSYGVANIGTWLLVNTDLSKFRGRLRSDSQYVSVGTPF